MEDQVIVCKEKGDACEGEFTFTVGEQGYYRSKGFSNPSRCVPCRRKKRPHFLDQQQEGAQSSTDEEV